MAIFAVLSREMYRYLYRKGLIDRDCGNRHMLINSLSHYGPLNEDFKDEEIGVFDSYREDFCHRWVFELRLIKNRNKVLKKIII